MKRLILTCYMWLGLTALAQAHLLNMTRVNVDIDASGAGEVILEADLTKALGGGEAYYALSQTASVQQSDVFRELLATLMSASQLSVGPQPVHWQFTNVEWPVAPKDDFVSGLAWPMTRFYFTFQLPPGFSKASLNAVFTDIFKFEEPVALTISFNQEQVSLSRWLVRNQASPAFYFAKQPQETAISTGDVQQWLSYLKQGMLHIVPFGWDHALFVLGLLFGVTTFRQLALLITAFTLAHTVTLGLATFGAIVVSSRIIEPLIALSIVWLAVENVLFKPRPGWRFLLVFGFGLVHGLGFAQALKALGIPSSGYTGALVSFNIGVELAQLGIVVVASILLYAGKRINGFPRLMNRGGSAIIALIAGLWFAERVLS